LTPEDKVLRETDSPLEGEGFEPSVPREREAERTRKAPVSFAERQVSEGLSNPIYTGRIAHKGELYPGQQPALIDDETWTAVRNQLAANTSDHRRKAKAAEPSLLAGLLVDPRGEARAS
jgi:site-specific DNA recombinase